MLLQKLLAAPTVPDGQMDRLKPPSQGLVSDQENSWFIHDFCPNKGICVMHWNKVPFCDGKQNRPTSASAKADHGGGLLVPFHLFLCRS